MAFGKEMGMMGGKTKLKPSMAGKPEGKPKEDSKGDDKHEGKEEGDGSKHFHVSHDGLSYQAHGESEDGQKEEPVDHPDLQSVQGHMQQFMGDEGDGQAQQMPPMHHTGMGGGF